MNQPAPAPSAPSAKTAATATVSPDQQRLALIIEAEAVQLGEFIAVLEREQSLLIEGQTDALLTLSQEKNERYRQLQRLNDERSQLLLRSGHGLSDAAIRKIFARLPRVLSRWDEVLGLARIARDHNALNGQLIVERMANNQAALSILLAAADKPQLYNAEGMARPTGSGRILGSA
ncbi:MAG: flagellar protein FlgN [Thauera sp.]|jgi:flagella synthesis protein FlgN|nr:flagellar protein FlgN [Thauera sp.]